MISLVSASLVSACAETFFGQSLFPSPLPNNQQLKKSHKKAYVYLKLGVDG